MSLTPLNHGRIGAHSELLLKSLGVDAKLDGGVGVVTIEHVTAVQLALARLRGEVMVASPEATRLALRLLDPDRTPASDFHLQRTLITVQNILESAYLAGG